MQSGFSQRGGWRGGRWGVIEVFGGLSGGEVRVRVALDGRKAGSGQEDEDVVGGGGG